MAKKKSLFFHFHLLAKKKSLFFYFRFMFDRLTASVHWRLPCTMSPARIDHCSYLWFCCWKQFFQLSARRALPPRDP